MIEEIMPYNINFKYNFVKINNTYHSYWYAKTYKDSLEMLNNIANLAQEKDVYMSICVNNLDSSKFLRKINEKISLANSEAKSLKGEQIDYDLINKSSEESKILRYLIQVEGEKIYEVSSIIAICSKNLDELILKENNIRNKACALGTDIAPLNFSQKEGHMLSLPIQFECLPVEKRINRVFTTSSLSCLFPFYTGRMYQENGVIIGEANNDTCVIDFKSKKNNNHNAVVLGSSGAGKSFFIKLIVLQYLYKGMKQIILDPEGEYIEIARKLGQRIVNKDNFNPLEIEELFAINNSENYMDLKLGKIAEILKLKDIFSSEEKIDIVLQAVRKIYIEAGINNNINTLYRSTNENNIYCEKKYIPNNAFPKIEKLKEAIKELKITNKERQELIRHIDRYKCQDSQFDEDVLIVFDITNKDKEWIDCIASVIDEYTFGNAMIYVDEMWQLISNYPEKMAPKISELFKTIRKRGSGIVGITQDVSDILSYENGNLGKSIINNSYIKAYFKMEYLDVDNLQNLGVCRKEDYIKIKQLNKGYAFIDYGGNTFNAEIIAQESDKEIIERGSYEENINSAR